MSSVILTAILTLAILLFGVPIIFGLFRLFGFYVIVKERQSIVYVLFGSVVGIIDEPGIHFLWFKFGLRALIMNYLGNKYTVDMRLDQEYIRSQPVNSEEGAPMGIGLWYEMYISDATSYLFKNTDPRGSLNANVGNATVRCLSNLPLEKMMVDRHKMSQTVRIDASQKSNEWGYMVGSAYVRKVHFRDTEMISQIESKVVNRLRQVTSAIKQDGANQVSIISSTAERMAAIEFGKAAAIRPKIVGEALQKIAEDQDVTSTMFEILETNRIMDAKTPIEIIPANSEILKQMIVSQKTYD